MNKQILLLLALVAVAYPLCMNGTAGCSNCPSTTGDCFGCDTTLNFVATPDATTKQCVCDTGFFYVSTGSGSCSACSVGCATCVNTTICTACNTDENFVANGTSCRCADGYYKNTSDICVACAPGFGAACLTCDSSTCLTCSGDNAVASGQTVCSKKCSIDRCLTCYNSTVCSQCVPNAALSLSLATCTCATTGFFSTATACTACIANCDVCTAATGCVTCSTGFVFSTTTSTCVAFESHVKLALLLVIAVLAFAM